jgi:GT2 family glycosyltransferase
MGQLQRRTASEGLMIPVLILTRNCLELTKLCVDSIWRQNVPVQICIYDNGSTDGTVLWADEEPEIDLTAMPDNKGVSIGWNTVLSRLFDEGESHVLVLNNDAILPSWFLSELLSYDAPFVTGVAIDKQPVAKPERMPLNPHPDFSAFLIKRDCWMKVGSFDERMKIYSSDCDYHIRAHRLGVPLWKANVPYYHVNSQTLKRATPEDRAIIEAQANADRAVFKSIYGCLPGTAEYEALFKEGK